MSRPRTRVSAVTLSSPDTRALAAFYERLLGWTRVDVHLIDRTTGAAWDELL